MSKAILFGLAATLTACQQQSNSTEKLFFDIEGFTNGLVEELNSSAPEVKKFSRINTEESEQTLKTINWSKELELLRQSDLNKSAYSLSYKQEKTENSLVYTLNSDENLPIKELIIQFDSLGKPAQISSRHHTQNYLYGSEKDLSMNFSDGHLTSYDIKGWQELFVGGRKEFEVKGEIVN